MSRPSAKRNAGTKRTTAMRRQDENSELTELSAVLPMVRNSSSVDKISVVRLTTAYLKFRMFLHEANISWDHNLDAVYASAGGDPEDLAVKTVSVPNGVQKKKVPPSNGIFDLSAMLNKAMDGFLMVVAPDLTVLYVPEYVTECIGLTQTEIIGQNLLDLTHSDDQNSVERNLIYDPTDNSRRQWRQFCVRFRTSLNTPRSPLSKFSGHKMMQISGFLKCADPSSSDNQEHPKSLGLIAECRPIESMSIVELAIERSSFTTTTTLDLKFTAVESRVKTLIGFEPEEMMGLHAYDFFHPSDFKACQPNSERAIKCRLTLLNQGRVVSPIHRFLTKTGDWIWVQMVCVLSFVPGTKTPFDIKVTFRIVSSEVDRVNFIEHTEAYKEDSVLKSIQEPYQVHLENNTQFKPLGMDPKRNVRAHYVKPAPEATVHHEQDILNEAISQTRVSSDVLETLRFSREFALRSFESGNGIKRAIGVDGEELVSLYPKNHSNLPSNPGVTEAFLEPTMTDSIPYSSPIVSTESGSLSSLKSLRSSRMSTSPPRYTPPSATNSTHSPQSFTDSPQGMSSFVPMATPVSQTQSSNLSLSGNTIHSQHVSMATNSAHIPPSTSHVSLTTNSAHNPPCDLHLTDSHNGYNSVSSMSSIQSPPSRVAELCSLTNVGNVGSPCPSDSSGFCSVGSPDNVTHHNVFTPHMTSDCPHQEQYSTMVEQPYVQPNSSYGQTVAFESSYVHQSQAVLSHVQTSQAGSPYIQTSQVGSPYIQTSQVGSPYVQTSQVGSSYVQTSQVGSPYVQTSQVRSPYVQTSQIGQSYSQTAQMKSSHIQPSFSGEVPTAHTVNGDTRSKPVIPNVTAGNLVPPLPVDGNFDLDRFLQQYV